MYRHTVRKGPQAAGQEPIVTAPEGIIGVLTLPTAHQAQATVTMPWTSVLRRDLAACQTRHTCAAGPHQTLLVEVPLRSPVESIARTVSVSVGNIRDSK